MRYAVCIAMRCDTIRYDTVRYVLNKTRIGLNHYAKCVGTGTNRREGGDGGRTNETTKPSMNV